MMILGIIRSLLGRCPACGGPLIRIKHDCMFGDTYRCGWCGEKWRDAY